MAVIVSLDIADPAAAWTDLGFVVDGATARVGSVAHRLGAAGKDQRKIVTAVARELLGFIWAIGTRAETVSRLQVAA